MVNTFLTYSDFSKSAQACDMRRLGKGRLESFQILNIIQNLNLLGKLWEFPYVPTCMSLREWSQILVRKYKSLPYIYIIRDGQCYGINKLLTIEIKPGCTLIYTLINKKYIFTRAVNLIVQRTSTDIYVLDGKDKYKIANNIPAPLVENDYIVKVGYAINPIVRMWYGYEDALKHYINAHIDEWIRRGYKNTMKRYIVPENFERPKWTYDEELHKNHRAALLDKEITRKEKPWYVHMKDFVEAGPFTGYKWYDNV